jgi:hypothetical protein
VHGRASFLEIQIRQLFEVADGRVVKDGCLELVDSATTRKPVERTSQQIHVGKNLRDDIDQRPESAAKQDDPEPVGVGPSADEMDYRHGLQDESPRVKQTDESHESS